VQHRRSSSITYPLTLASRRRSRHIAKPKASYYAYTDVDTANTPTPLRITTNPNSKPPKRRFSQFTYNLPSTPSTHIPSPYLSHFKPYPPGHPNAAWQRKNSAETVDSLEFLSGHEYKRQKTTS
jgi:hypothetical protein